MRAIGATRERFTAPANLAQRCPRPPHPEPRAVTIRESPLPGRDEHLMPQIRNSVKKNISRRWLDGLSGVLPVGCHDVKRRAHLKQHARGLSNVHPWVYLAPLAGPRRASLTLRGRSLPAMRSIVRCDRVRGASASSALTVYAEAAPHHNPLPVKNGERERTALCRNSTAKWGDS